MRKLLRGTLMMLVAAALMTGCNKTDADQVANAISDICTNVRGASAIYWDLENGIIRTDLPGGIPPTVDNIGGVFSHQAFPLLGFSYPIGWTPEQIGGSGVVGVNLLRNDNKAIWRNVAFPAPYSTVTQIRDFEISALLDFFGLGTTYETVCFNPQTVTVAPGIDISTYNIMIRAGGHTAVIISSLTSGYSIIQAQGNVRVASAPTNEWDAEIFDTFLAIEFQLLIGDPDNLNNGDRDNDGTPDHLDNFPDDPTRA